MESKKKDLEIICNLQWKNQPANGGDKSNIIGMYDIPCTTLNWDLFKSYLLKNSGADLDDVKVFYVTSNDREFPIESQTDFQIALYAFRRKAMNNEIINLKLDRVSKSEQKATTSAAKSKSIDVETQSDTVDSSLKTGTGEMADGDNPPVWFAHYMAQFKEQLISDVKTVISDSVTNVQPTEAQASVPTCSYHHSSRKPKSDAKRIRKMTVPTIERNERELLKSARMERKLESKLEKLENKTKKLREKKLALFNKSTSDSDGGPTCSTKRFDRKRNYPNHLKGHAPPSEEKPDLDAPREDVIYEMDSAVLTRDRPLFFRGGEVFYWTWHVKNTGRKSWTGDTYATFTWGSKALQPVQYSIQCPKLKPNETGKISILFDIPCEKGKYECYYHFHHKERRFGQCLSVRIYVDPLGEYEMMNSSTESNNVQQQQQESNKEADLPVEEKEPYDMTDLKQSLAAALKLKIMSVPDDQKDHDTFCTSDSDNQSDGSDSDDVSKDEFVVVPVPDCFKLDTIKTKALKDANDKTQEETAVAGSSSNCYRVDSCDLFVDWPKKVEDVAVKAEDNFDDNNNTESRSSSVDNGSNQSDTVVIVRDNAEDGYAYVEVNGKGIHVPRKILKSEYIEKPEEKNIAEKTCTPSTISVASGSVVVVNGDEDDNVTQTDKNVESILRVIADEPENLITLNQSVGNSQDNLPSAPKLSSILAQKNDDESDAHISEESVNILSSSFRGYNRTFVFPQGKPGFEVYPTYTDGNLDESIKAAEQTAAPSNASNPFTNYHQPVPNFQQTPPELRMAPDPEVMRLINEPESRSPPPQPPVISHQPSPAAVHILPENLVTGAVNVASSAISTARSVINMIVPPRPSWVGDEWNPNSADRDEYQRVLAEMGFWNQELNASLLIKHKNDLSRVVADLVQ